MSGIRDHKIFKVTIEGEKEYYPRDAFGDICGRIGRESHKVVKHIIAPVASIAEAHVRYWIPFSGWVEGTVIVTVDKGTVIDAFIEEHTW